MASELKAKQMFCVALLEQLGGSVLTCRAKYISAQPQRWANREFSQHFGRDFDPQFK